MNLILRILVFLLLSGPILHPPFSMAQTSTNTNTALNAREQGIVAISAATARGDMTTLKGALAAGLDAGLTVNEIKEVLVQLYAYCGFPRSLNALGTFMELVDERGGKDALG
ncbi:MAG: carboxymuconolactone decarboxylase family protein, partial [Bacteroidetes bacterium]|nr:carboxymuconolactone decarboxylase family protein [Bacteroidota bacterium]